MDFDSSFLNEETIKNLIINLIENHNIKSLHILLKNKKEILNFLENFIEKKIFI